jgi:hypothetical protein
MQRIQTSSGKCSTGRKIDKEIKLMTEKQTIKRELLRVECPKWSENKLVLLVISKNQLTKIEWKESKSNSRGNSRRPLYGTFQK